MTEHTKLYRALWRWHFYAGLLSLPFVIILSITGSIYLFKPQLEAFREAQYQLPATPTRVAAPANKVIAAALTHASKTLGPAKFKSYRLTTNPTKATRVTIQTNTGAYYLYVNPFDLSVVGQVQKSRVFIEWVKDLHGELLSGRPGTILVELAASWSIILIISGLYLWWPQTGKSFWRALLPRLNAKGRPLWRSLHSAVGIWLSFFVLFLLVSGLPWTSVWGAAFKESRKILSNESSLDWQTNSPAAQPSWRTSAVSTYNLTPQVLQQATALNLSPPVELSVSNEKTMVWKVASQTQNRPLRSTAWINGLTGEVTKLEAFTHKPLVDKIVGTGIAAHEGHLFGWPNQLLGIITTLGLIFLSVSGFIMWRKRKPTGALGAPPRTQKPYWPLALLIPMVLLPTALASFILIWVVDKWVSKKIWANF